ncbi:YcnI family copper-binding membrane protein [Wohlfahrtiimonas populi]|uniref:YcnI family copper-binding membrane protein n=1 Tax=Wohlfahrtiimonas populi TaxID=1940240 RepID=UPI00098CF86D|nr:YcnI family protein [Wohlfahrtiimonas populi]
MNFKFASFIITPLLLSQIATAHVSFIDAKPMTEGKPFKATFAIPHGCEGTPTTKVTIKIPEGVIGIKPMSKSGWTLSTETIQYAKTYQQYGKDVTQGVSSITWEGSLPDQYYDEFTITGYFADNANNSEALYFPVIQNCEVGEYLWTDTSGHQHHGHDSKELNAPSLKVAK